jgi:hypothetical protein
MTEHAVEKQNLPSLKKAHMSGSQVKTGLVCFFGHKGIVHYEFIAQGQNQLFGSADKVTGICSEEKTRTLA